MSQDNSKDIVKCASIILAESLLYPVSSILTRIQTNNLNILALKQPLSSFYGVGSIVTSLPAFLFRLKVCDVAHPIVQNRFGLSQFTTFFLVSGFADIVSCIIRCPTEHWRQQFQTGMYSSIKDLYKDILGYKGPLGLWSGFSVYLGREVAFNTIRFGILSYLQEREKRTPTFTKQQKRANYREYFNDSASYERKQKAQAFAQFKAFQWMNTIATITAAILSTPFDIMKTRVMTDILHDHKPLRAHFNQLISEEGVFALFKGAGIRAFYMCALISSFLSLDFYLSSPIQEAQRITQKVVELQRDNDS
ncbi:PET8 [Blepharisma stoltei]|uniref:Mitochondrial carrier protein n=1 Tax=Blepharisma stoltei TaxID=1481888 RepID=A0AAU9JCJ6_9CILI|nr:unnamed protein product [Blepharisma stoltei]